VPEGIASSLLSKTGEEFVKIIGAARGLAVGVTHSSSSRTRPRRMADNLPSSSKTTEPSCKTTIACLPFTMYPVIAGGLGFGLFSCAFSPGCAGTLGFTP